MKAINLIRRIRTLQMIGAPLWHYWHIANELEQCIASHFEGVGD